MPPEINTSSTSGAASTPTSVAETPIVGETSTPSESSPGSDFEGLGGDFDDTIDYVETPSSEKEVQKEAVPAPVAEVKEPPAEPAPVAPAPTAPSQTPPQPQEAQPQATPAAQPEAADTPNRSLQELLTEHRDTLIGQLVEQKFKLTPAQQEALENDAVNEFPKLMANVYLEAMTATVNHLQNSVPLLIRHQMAAMDREKAAETDFFGKFGMLNREKHAQDIVAFANSFKAANPKISRDDLFAMVGAAVMAKHGISAVAPGGPAPMPNGNGAAIPQPAPFVPARPGASVKVTPEVNEFMGLGGDYDDE